VWWHHNDATQQNEHIQNSCSFTINNKNRNNKTTQLQNNKYNYKQTQRREKERERELRTIFFRFFSFFVFCLKKVESVRTWLFHQTTTRLLKRATQHHKTPPKMKIEIDASQV